MGLNNFWDTCFRLFVISASIPSALSVPSTKQGSLGGGLTILTYNDLDNKPVPRSGAILINQASSCSLGVTSCNLLGEHPWSPGSKKTFPLNNSLSYQIYQGLFPRSQLFWISGLNKNGSCLAITYQGISSDVDCEKELPILCTQTAPVSNWTSVDTSAKFQITQQVGSRSLTGYRDFYTWKFIGVRYAAKPKRFTYSSLYTGTEPETVVSPAADCQQVIGQVTTGMSEDCLFLNIWTPYIAPLSLSKISRAHLKPVMFYIMGGGFVTGSASNLNTDGTNLASRGDVVVVALSYRLGYFGFMAYPDGVHNGSYGIGDMITALEWVSKNIKALGGDPECVTIFGESAGATAVRALLSSPKAQGLFVNAIMQSPPDGWDPAAKYSKYMTISEYSRSFTENALNSTGCVGVPNPIECLERVDATALANLQTAAQFPVLDGIYLTHDLTFNNTSGYTTSVSLLAGINRDEVGIMIPYYPPEGMTIAQYFAILTSAGFRVPLTNTTNTVFSIPSSPTSDEIFNITVRMGTDTLFKCALQSTVNTAASHGSFRRVYAYEFNRTYSTPNYTTMHCSAPVNANHPFGDPNAEYYKCHGGEQLYTFGAFRRGLPDRDGLDVKFDQQVVDYWSSFAWSGNPNPSLQLLEARGYWSTLERIKATGLWDEVKPGRSALRVLQWDGLMTVAFEEGEQCAFLGLGLDFYESN